MAVNGIPFDYVPATHEDLARCLADPMWRLCSGQLYKIMVKSDDGNGSVIPFRPNRAQQILIGWLWHRNIILKARQLGFTTLVAIMWLDHALFNADQRCGMIAQDREAAEIIFRDKVKLAYDRLPDQLREAMPLATQNKSELLFAHNNSSVRVATSMRSGTINRLHVSEFGKICAKAPDKAVEVVTGSLPAVPIDGISIIESTSEGQGGEFHSMCVRAESMMDQGTELTERDYRFHFFPWHEEPGYRMVTTNVVITEKDVEYFTQVEAECKCTIDAEQRNWYVATRDSDFSGDPEKMWKEYPSTPKEAFQQSTEGTYYAVQLSAARKTGRIGLFPHVEGSVVNTFWDIGNSDGTAIWFHQRIGAENRFIKFIEGWGEPYSYYIQKMQGFSYLWGTHYLPHDGAHKRQQGDKIASPLDELSKFKIGGKWETVPRVDDVNHGIQKTREVFSQCTFDEAGCKEGVAHLSQYKKEWNSRLGCWGSLPRHDIHSESADALRQFGQGFVAPSFIEKERRTRRERNWKTT